MYVELLRARRSAFDLVSACMKADTTSDARRPGWDIEDCVYAHFREVEGWFSSGTAEIVI